MRHHAAIVGWGGYTPSRVLSNADLERTIDTSDAWIRSRTGISQRRIAAPGETTASMCVQAARKALIHCQLKAEQIGLIICATTTPDYLLPTTACLIQQELGAHNAGAFDVNTACTGLLYAMSIAGKFIECEPNKKILVVAGETLSRFIDWKDRNTCILFGDGACALVLEGTTQNAGIISSVLGSRGDTERMLVIEGGGGARPASADSLAEGSHFIRMRGNDVFKMAVRSMAQASQDAMDQAGIQANDLRAVIPHQANRRIIEATQESLGVDPDKVVVNVDRLGNTGAASVGLAFIEYAERNPPQPGDYFLMVSFGGGLTWAASVIRWPNLAAGEIRRAA